MRHAFFSMLAIVCLIAANGCATKVTRTDTDTTVDLSGAWNDVDSRQTAKTMINDVLSRPWLTDFERDAGNKPRVIVGRVRNQTNQHIPTGTFVRDLERELLNSGRVRFVAGGAEREQIREEREDQQYNASQETRANMRQEYGADYMLQGTIETTTDRAGNMQVVFYQVDMYLTDLESNERIWLGSHEIKKEVKRQKARL